VTGFFISLAGQAVGGEGASEMFLASRAAQNLRFQRLMKSTVRLQRSRHAAAATRPCC